MGTVSFDRLIASADEETLRDLLGPSVTRLVTRLDPDLTRPSNLRRLLMRSTTATALLRSKASRAVLLRSLEPSDAAALSDQLNLPNATSVSQLFDQLTSATIAKRSSRERELFAYFGVHPDTDEEPQREPVVCDVNPSYPLFDHQRDAVNRLSAALREGAGRAVLHMPTGSGKTRTAMNVICDYLRANEPAIAVWLAHSEELCSQAATEFETAWKHLGNRSLTVNRFWGAGEIDTSTAVDGFVVCGLGKIYSSIKTSYQVWATLADRTRLVVMDEAHQALAPTYLDTLELLVERHSGTKLLGLTATPGRTWNDVDEDEKLSRIFDRRKITLRVEGYTNPVDYLVDNGYLARPTFRSLTYAGGAELTDRDIRDLELAIDVPESILRTLATDDARNLLIVHTVEQISHRHARIIVFAATAEHAHILAAVAEARGVAATAITSGTPSHERQRRIAEFKSSSEVTRVLFNYGVLTTGFDAPRTSAAVIARPTKSLVLYSQMVGRATRGTRAGGNESAEIFTVVDTTLPGFGEMSEAFSNWEDVWDEF